MIYSSVNVFALNRVPLSAQRVLDVGCGSGTLGREIKQRIGSHVVGITYSPEEAALASKELDQVLVRDLNQFDVREAGRFDCVICSHVLEHLMEPEVLLSRLLGSLNPAGILIVILPNILFWKQRFEFLRGEFKYTEDGLMDRTHFRFYDWQSARALLINSGYVIKESAVEGMVPLRGLRGIFPQLCRRVDEAMARRFPGLFAFQFIFSCSPENKTMIPSVDTLSRQPVPLS